MVLSRIHNIGLKVIDLLILVVALLFITGGAVASGDLEVLSFGFLQLALIVFVVYSVSVLIVGVLCLSISSDSWFSRISKSAISGLLLFLLFPWLIGIVMFLLQYQLTTDAQTVLLVTTMIRSIVRALLGRHWDAL